MENVFISISDCCRFLCLGRTKIYSLILAGELTKAKIGRRSFITTESAQALAERSIMKEQSNVSS